LDLVPNNIAHFDIAADDVERARRFYERVFGWRFDAWGPPDFYLIHTGTADDPGIHGSVSKRLDPLSGAGRAGFECTIAVRDLAAIRAAIVANGGRILLEQHEIVGVGRLIRFLDSEGNSVCAMHYA
jgi:predicted enzyme related to lactoylglutathione lyase